METRSGRGLRHENFREEEKKNKLFYIYYQIKILLRFKLFRYYLNTKQKTSSTVVFHPKGLIKGQGDHKNRNTYLSRPLL